MAVRGGGGESSAAAARGFAAQRGPSPALPAELPEGVRVGLDTKLAAVVGGRTASAFQRAFGIATVGDLLGHYPRRYQKRGELTALASLPLDEPVTIVAEVVDVRERPMRAKRGSILEVRLTDGSGTLALTFFNQSWRSRELVPGARGIFAGKVTEYRGSRQLAHPDYELFADDDERAARLNAADDGEAKRWAERPVPIYPASGTVASWQIARVVELTLDALGEIADPVPADIRRGRGISGFAEALNHIHRPANEGDYRSARRTLRFHEAFVLQSALLQQRLVARELQSTSRVPAPGGFLDRFDARLAFALTGDQLTVGAEIAADLADTHPMNRLVQGEVGSGKTLVAIRAMLAVADSGGQSALLAPTEVLASQHLRSIAKMLGPDLSAELFPTLVTGQLSTAERRKATLRTVSGQSRIVVGTHALLSDAVEFYDLGLVVVDEQHRFGVDQREALRVKGRTPPHVLVLTATPIPRTVAMTVFGDLDVSTITELPAGRQGIESFVVPLAEHPNWRNRVWERASEEIGRGHQVFVVCPAISPREREEGDEPEHADAPDRASSPHQGDTPQQAERMPPADVETTLAMLRQHPLLASRRLAAVHGRLSADEKDRVMQAFAAGELDLIVATTVIEVGVDVPNASCMIVLDADRFGVSQLHQLRGRVGRGTVAGLCLLVTTAEPESLARERVDAVASTTDGFELARVDMELRREGDVLGARQSGGRSSLRLLRVADHGDVIADAREAAHSVLASDPQLREHPALASALARRLDEAERRFLSKA